MSFFCSSVWLLSDLLFRFFLSLPFSLYFISLWYIDLSFILPLPLLSCRRLFFFFFAFYSPVLYFLFSTSSSVSSLLSLFFFSFGDSPCCLMASQHCWGQLDMSWWHGWLYCLLLSLPVWADHLTWAGQMIQDQKKQEEHEGHITLCLFILLTGLFQVILHVISCGNNSA